MYVYIFKCSVAQSAGIAEYTDCISVDGLLPNECPAYDIKHSEGEPLTMLEVKGMRGTYSLPSLPGPIWPGVVALEKGPIYGLNRIKQCTYAKLNGLK